MRWNWLMGESKTRKHCNKTWPFRPPDWYIMDFKSIYRKKVWRKQMTCLGDSDNNEMWWNMMEGQLWRNPGCLRLSCDFQNVRSLAPWRRPWKSCQRKRNWKRRPPAPNRTAGMGYDGLWGAVTGLMPSDCTGQGEILTWEVLEQPNCKVDLIILIFDMSSECVNLIGMEMLWVHSGTWRTVLVPGAKVWQQPSPCRSLTRSIRPWQHLGRRCIPELKVFLCFLCSPIFCIQRYSKYFKVKYSGKIHHRSPLRRLYISMSIYVYISIIWKKPSHFPNMFYHLLFIMFSKF